jgi:beta-glucosidase
MRDPATAFPNDFLWGAATSAYQIEGAVGEDGRGQTIWDTLCRVPGAIHAGDTGDVAVDHYHRYREDVALMHELGLRAYRFSIAWSRVLPTGSGSVNERGLDFYRRLVDELLASGIVPMATLYHWDLPQALEDAGGWPARDTALRFADYAAVAFEALHDRVSLWATLNEPWCSSLLGYAAGEHAPGIRDPRRATRAIHHLLLGHGLAVRAMRAIDQGPDHGIVLNLVPVYAIADEPSPILRDGLRRYDGLRNRVWTEPVLRGRYPEDVGADLEVFGGLPIEPGDLDLISLPLDWLGVNYYNDQILEEAPGATMASAPGVLGVRGRAPGPDATVMGWPVTPRGLRDLLVGLRSTYPDLPPVYITENGVAYDDPPSSNGRVADVRRIRYLEDHLLSLGKAIDEGCDVRGYFVWSLMDNFEWARGYRPRFGIVHIDFETQRRTPRDSARWYREVATTDRIPARER